MDKKQEGYIHSLNSDFSGGLPGDSHDDYPSITGCDPETRPLKPSDKQVGGTHYKKYPIQPAEYCQKNRLNHLESAVVKYVTRHSDKGGEQDIYKAIECLELILEWEYNKYQ